LIKAIIKDENSSKIYHTHHSSQKDDFLPDVLTLQSRKERTVSEEIIKKIKLK
jgi:hypothetical protein